MRVVSADRMIIITCKMDGSGVGESAGCAGAASVTYRLIWPWSFIL